MCLNELVACGKGMGEGRGGRGWRRVFKGGWLDYT